MKLALFSTTESNILINKKCYTNGKKNKMNQET